MPGRYLIWQNGRLTIKRYWKPEFHPDESKSLEDWADEIHSTIQEIMPEVRMISQTFSMTILKLHMKKIRKSIFILLKIQNK